MNLDRIEVEVVFELISSRNAVVDEFRSDRSFTLSCVFKLISSRNAVVNKLKLEMGTFSPLNNNSIMIQY